MVVSSIPTLSPTTVLRMKTTNEQMNQHITTIKGKPGVLSLHCITFHARAHTPQEQDIPYIPDQISMRCGRTCGRTVRGRRKVVVVAAVEEELLRKKSQTTIAVAYQDPRISPFHLQRQLPLAPCHPPCQSKEVLTRSLIRSFSQSIGRLVERGKKQLHRETRDKKVTLNIARNRSRPLAHHILIYTLKDATRNSQPQLALPSSIRPYAHPHQE
ncbi:hypothetical protein BKA65DRAFT_185108 [Rhexocercosporidium sp. MPI-PUGE-AT-0058]|nr:hypothetical protein BKA65DRAFT_185108 [Rhexocercosporidium sp. MPI-PUGE-AT-0058]